MTITTSSTPTANTTLLVQLQRSLDGGTTWPNDGVSEPVGSYYFTAASGTVHVPMVISGA